MKGQLARQMGFCLPLEMRARGIRLSHTHICHPEDQCVSRAFLWVHAKPRPPGKTSQELDFNYDILFQSAFSSQTQRYTLEYQCSRDRSKRTVASSRLV